MRFAAWLFRLTFFSVLVFAHPLFAQPSAKSGPSEAALRAGFSKTDITPADPVRMSGYRSRRDVSTGVHDRLYARVAAFESDGKRLVLISTDLIGFYDDTAESFRKAICDRYQLEPSELFLCGTHTHAGPTPTLSADIHPNNVKYTQNLKATLVEAVGRAIHEARPAHLGVGRGYSPVGMNRRETRDDGTVRLGRNPYGPTDKEVLVLKVTAPDGTPKAALFDYATHGTSLGPKNLVISSDVLGLAAQFVEKIVGSNATAPVFAGASGNIDPWYRVLPSFNTEEGWIPETELLGILLGEEAVRVFREAKATDAKREIGTAFATLQLPRKEGDEDSDSPTKPLRVTAARIGDTGFLGLGCELLTEVGLAIKAGSPYEHTFVITHCNGAAGYLPPKHLYKEGGYEIDSTGFAPQAADILVKKALEMLYGLK